MLILSNYIYNVKIEIALIIINGFKFSRYFELSVGLTEGNFLADLSILS